jgi:hypothetical protein
MATTTIGDELAKVRDAVDGKSKLMDGMAFNSDQPANRKTRLASSVSAEATP